MAAQYANEFKLIVTELYKSGIKTKHISDDYAINDSMISRWSQEYHSKSGDYFK